MIEQRRAAFEQQQTESRTAFSTPRVDRLSTGRVGELKTAFESTSNTQTKDEVSDFRAPIVAGLTEQRRKLFEDQEQTSSYRPPVRISDALSVALAQSLLLFLRACVYLEGQLPFRSTNRIKRDTEPTYHVEHFIDHRNVSMI